VIALPRLLAKQRTRGRGVVGEVEAHVSTFLPGGRVAEALSSSQISPALQQRVLSSYDELSLLTVGLGRVEGYSRVLAL
jgi:hypothetical protein